MKVQLVFFIPQDFTEKILTYIGRLGAGRIGKYSHCSFATGGWARFKPDDMAQPYYGKAGEIAKVREDRVEILCLRSEVKKIISEVKKLHPYEEVGFSIFPVLDECELE